MIHPELLRDQGILIITPEGPLQESDFVSLAKLVDPFIESEGELHGLLIHTKSFPGWKNETMPPVGQILVLCCHISNLLKITTSTLQKSPP